MEITQTNSNLSSTSSKNAASSQEPSIPVVPTKELKEDERRPSISEVDDSDSDGDFNASETGENEGKRRISFDSSASSDRKEAKRKCEKVRRARFNTKIEELKRSILRVNKENIWRSWSWTKEDVLVEAYVVIKDLMERKDDLRRTLHHMLLEEHAAHHTMPKFEDEGAIIN